ncbi:MAG: ABC transporter substrate-binding protein [Deltaproteobacteria bacterium]|jgi:peptide/nickel transport system substrate-binding protein|nr:ABC transporter substrate-binding protein [Deltaproteobacteria bacterium]
MFIGVNFKLRSLTVATILILAFVLAGDLRAADEADKNLRYGSTFSNTSIDPANAFDGWFAVTIGLVETLVRLDAQMKPVPWLAESVENVDPTTWKVTVRDKITFHNGRDVTAQAVKDSLERVIGKLGRAKDGLLIDSIEVRGQTLTIKTTKPHPTFINNLCEPFSAIVFTGEISDLVVYGTGPFKVDSFRPNGNAQMVRYDGYWGGPAKLDRYTQVYLADAGTLSMAMQSGELDVTMDIPGPNRHSFINNPDYVIDSVPSSRALFLYHNYKNPFLADKNVRRAINLALDKKTFCDVLLSGSCVPANGLFPAFLPYAGDKLKSEAYDMDAAKATLEAAGYKVGPNGVRQKDGKNLSLTVYAYTSRVELPILAEAVQAQLTELGIETKIDIMESVEDRLKTGDFDLVIYSLITTPLGDPYTMLDNLIKTNGFYNYGKYSDPESDKEIAQMAGEFDLSKKAATAIKVQQKALDDYAFGFIGHLSRTQIRNKRVVDLPNEPAGFNGVTNKTDLKD